MGVANGREGRVVSRNGREGGGRRWRDAGERGRKKRREGGKGEGRVNCRGGRKDQIKIKRIVKNV